MRVGIPNGVRHPFLIAAVAAGLLNGACGLDKVQQPQLAGPSETGLSAEMIAFPDVVNADGVSQSVVEMTLRDANGKAVAGRAVLFCTTPTVSGAPFSTPALNVLDCDSSTSTPAGFGNAATLNPQTGFTFVGPVQSGIVMATNADGKARVFWVAGTDHNTIIVVAVRTYGIDAARGFLQTVQIFQQ
jgi:hypothetical protein